MTMNAIMIDGWIEGAWTVTWVKPKTRRTDSRFAPSQWETALLCNDVSHWLSASLESAMKTILRVLFALILLYLHLTILVNSFTHLPHWHRGNHKWNRNVDNGFDGHVGEIAAIVHVIFINSTSISLLLSPRYNIKISQCLTFHLTIFIWNSQSWMEISLTKWTTRMSDQSVFTHQVFSFKHCIYSLIWFALRCPFYIMRVFFIRLIKKDRV